MFYAVAILLGIFSAIAAFLAMFEMFGLTGVSIVSLIPWFVAGLVGGAVTAMISPKHKTKLATLLGVTLSVTLTLVLLEAWILRDGFIRQPFYLQHGTIYLAPAFFLGSVLARGIRRAV